MEASRVQADTITIDREIVERFIIEVDALAQFDSIRNGLQATDYTEHVYGIVEPFERAALGTDALSDAYGQELHNRAIKRARELAREWFGHLFEAEGAVSAR